MFEHIKQAYAESIERTKWLDEPTKDTAMKKLKNLVPHIGYEDSLLKSDETIDEIHEKV